MSPSQRTRLASLGFGVTVAHPPRTQRPRPRSLTIRTSILWGLLDSQERSLLHPARDAQRAAGGRAGFQVHTQRTQDTALLPQGRVPRGPGQQWHKQPSINPPAHCVKPDGNL